VRNAYVSRLLRSVGSGKKREGRQGYNVKRRFGRVIKIKASQKRKTFIFGRQGRDGGLGKSSLKRRDSRGT